MLAELPVRYNVGLLGMGAFGGWLGVGGVGFLAALGMTEWGVGMTEWGGGMTWGL